MSRRLTELVLRADPSLDVAGQLTRLAQERAQAIRFDRVVRGVPYLEGLAGPQGMYFLLLPDAGTSREDVERAHRQLRADRDVVECRWVDLNRYHRSWDSLIEQPGADRPQKAAERPRSAA